MKKINLFRSFDYAGFFKDKKLAITAVKWNENKNMITCDIAIVYDGTDYGDVNVSNLYEKFKVSIPQSKQDDISKYVPGKEVALNNVYKATVYGEYGNELSIEGTLAYVKE